MTWAQPGARAQEPVPQQWESSFCLGLDGKSSSSCRAEQQRKALSGESLREDLLEEHVVSVGASVSLPSQ